MNLNKIQIIGRVGSIEDVRYTKTDTEVLKLSVATSRTYDGTEETTWHNITAFGKKADLIDQYVEVGQKLYVEGRLEKSEWTGDDGHTRRSSEIIAQRVQFGQKSGSGGGPGRASEGSQSPPGRPPVDEYEDDIPF